MASKKNTSGRKSLKNPAKNSRPGAYSSREGTRVTDSRSSRRRSSHSFRAVVGRYLSLALAIFLILFGAALIFWASVKNGFYLQDLKSNQLAPVESIPTSEERA